jgi:hypothetical protein
MAIPFTPATGTASIDAAEFSLPNGSTTLAPQTTATKLEAWIDASAVLAGDQVRVQILDRVNGGSQLVAWEGFITGATPQAYVLPVLDLNEGWDVRVKMVIGSARTFRWSLKMDVGDVNALTIAADAITSATIATDAIDADALKADAVTEIQSGLATAAAVAAVQADTDDIQTRIPSALDGSGNIKAGVQTILSTAIDAVASAIFAFTIEAAPVNATTFLQRLRVMWSVLAAAANGLAISANGTENFRDGANTKNRAIFTLATDGTRTPGTFDGT